MFILSLVLKTNHGEMQEVAKMRTFGNFIPLKRRIRIVFLEYLGRRDFKMSITDEYQVIYRQQTSMF